MSDTMQVVSWALEFTCPLRTSPPKENYPSSALQEIQFARTLARTSQDSRLGSGIFGDICVTGCELIEIPSALVPKSAVAPESGAIPLLRNLSINKGLERAHFPSIGFTISKELAKVGGLVELESMCSACPANAGRPQAAGCAGTIYKSPDSDEVETELRYLIKKLRVEKAVSETFPSTKYLWHSFWIRSPLSDKATELLGAILNEMAAESERSDELRKFVLATEISRRNRIQLHATMDPPGHVDLGWHTLFPHCPNCKAEANLKRWQQRYPKELHTCEVCGQQYSPAATASSSRVSDCWWNNSLRVLLGDQFAVFTESYLCGQGYSPENARKFIEIANTLDANTKARIVADKRRNEQREQFIQKRIYAGLSPVQLEDDDASGTSFFRPHEFAEVLERCRKIGANVVTIAHRSVNDELCMYKLCIGARATKPAGAIFEEWRASGCNEWFSATIGVPDQLLEQPPN